MWALLMVLAAGAFAGTVYQRKQTARENTDAYVQADDWEGTERIQPADGTPKQNTLKENEDTVKEKNGKAAESIKLDTLEFAAGSRFSWPLEGEVIRSFSMDETVYYPTLNQYRCSPGILIQAQQGTDVKSPVKAVVAEVGYSSEQGNYLLLDMGSGYQMMLSHLQEIAAEDGSIVEAGDVIAKTGKPSAGCSVEGDHLYMELSLDGEPQDPLDYLKW